jgi:hypothetical protein
MPGEKGKEVAASQSVDRLGIKTGRHDAKKP